MTPRRAALTGLALFLGVPRPTGAQAPYPLTPPGNCNVASATHERETIFRRAQIALTLRKALGGATPDPTVLKTVRAADPTDSVKNFVKDPLAIHPAPGEPLIVPSWGLLHCVADAVNGVKATVEQDQTIALEGVAPDALQAWSNLRGEASPDATRISQLHALVALRSVDFTTPLTHAAVSGTATGTAAEAASAAASSSGLVSQTDILIGLFKYLRDRAEDEAVYSTLKEVYGQFNGDKRFQSLAPKSLGVLAQLDHMSVRQLLPTLRTAAVSDLDRLPTALLSPPFLPATCEDAPSAKPEYLTKRPASPPAASPSPAANTTAPKSAPAAPAAASPAAPPPCDPKTQAAYELLSRGVTVLDAMRAGRPPVAAFATLASTSESDLHLDNIRAPLRILGSLANEYQLSDGHARDSVLNDGDLRRFFLAFLLDDAVQQDKAHSWTVSVRERITVYVTNGDVDMPAILTDLRALQDQIAKLTGPNAPKSDTAMATAIATGLSLAGQTVASAIHFAAANDQSLQTDTKTAVAVLTDVTDMVRAAAQRDYQRVVVVGLHVVGEFAPDLGSDPVYMRYLTAGASLASAKTPADVELVLQDVAEPVGSARLKRGRLPAGAVRKTITLNAYFGGGLAAEYTTGKGAPGGHGHPAVGLSVPIGPEYAWGFNGLPSFSIFVPLLDLGLLANYQFGNSNIKTNPNLSFRQVLAPGVDAVFGVSHSFPLSIGAGVQYAPALRRTTATNQSVDVVRVQVFGAVDMPIFRF